MVIQIRPQVYKFKGKNVLSDCSDLLISGPKGVVGNGSTLG
jgi:hypothetical protein